MGKVCVVRNFGWCTFRMISEDLFLLLLDEREGQFLPVPIGKIDMAMAGAVLMDLQFHGKIDTDLDSVIITDRTPVGNAVLDPILAEISTEDKQYTPGRLVADWAKRGQDIIALIVERLVERQILEKPEDDGRHFLTGRTAQLRRYRGADGVMREEVKLRLMRSLFEEGIPDPSDAALIGLANICGVFTHLLDSKELARIRDRIELFGQLDPVVRAVSNEVSAVGAKTRKDAEALSNEVSAVGAKTRKDAEALSNEIPFVEGPPFIRNTFQMLGNSHVYFKQQYRRYGPVFRLRVLGDHDRSCRA